MNGAAFGTSLMQLENLNNGKLRYVARMPRIPTPYARYINLHARVRIGHFTVVFFVTWPLSESEAVGNLVLIQTLLLFTCKSCCSHAN